MNKLFPFFCLLWLHLCCSNTNRKTQDISTSSMDTIPQDSSSNKPTIVRPVVGYRFVILGDFDGDGNKEQLTEHFFSQINHRETNKFYEGLTDYEQLVDSTIQKKPYSFVTSNSPNIDTLHISKNDQLFGLAYLKNEGDLNGDGTDEVSYVVHWADWSNINTWYIVTYKNNKWKTLYFFPIWDWQLPDLPETFNQYGLFGIDNKIINTVNDSINQQIEYDLINFTGLVKKINTNKIQVIYRNEAAEEDSMLVNLPKLK